MCALFLSLLACVAEVIDTGTAPSPPWETDADGDGYTADLDCDDLDAGVHPGAAEHCDGLDQDCDDIVDDEATDAPRWYADDDGDGYGADRRYSDACDPIAGWLESGGDCDDNAATVNPEASEVCNDADDNCDGEVDEGDPPGSPTWYADSDGDAFGDPEVGMVICVRPDGFVADSTDCDDTSAGISPGASELCDAADNDCDGVTDEEPTDGRPFYADDDGDGAGDATRAVNACSAPEGTVASDTDCDDTDASVSPGADETCDSRDEDCDGVIDEGAVDAPAWYPDADADGYGSPSASRTACTQPAFWAATDDDCDDADPELSPGEPEVCDGVDQDCDGVADDDAVDAPTWYADADVDGYGDPGRSTGACEQPAGWVADATDCDDLAAAVSPGAAESCDAQDNDCDGAVDEDAADAVAWYLDADGDGWGQGAALLSCDQPVGYGAHDGDCDDADLAISPDAVEICGGADEDCDGTVDEDDAVDATLWYADVDADAYGDPAASRSACVAPADHLLDGTDCDDTSPLVNPGRPETCNDGIDNNCNDDHDGCVREDDFSLTDIYHARFVGRTAGDDVGSSVSYAGDPDGDGIDDVMVGVVGFDEVWLYAGISYGDLDTDDVSAALFGGEGEGWGSAEAGVGDASGDGVDDILAGAPDGAGRAAVVEGPWTTILSLGYADVEFEGIGADDALGTAVAGADLDGDGLADFVLGAPGADGPATDSGAVYIVYGGATGVVDLAAADGVFGGVSTYTSIGAVVSCVGDVDGDGLQDVLIGAPSDRTAGTLAGAAFLVLGPASGALAAEASILGEAAYDRAGSAVAPAGDTDADGLDELLVGARYQDGGGADAGAAYLVRGPITGTVSLASAAAVLYGADPGDQAGIALAGVGDFDRDGFDDWAVGAWAAGAGYDGAAYLLYGPGPWDTDLGTADLRLVGSADSRAGLTVAGRTDGGDLTGDGVDDFIVGGPNSEGVGAAWIVPGSGY